jgi:hypothetical protein
VSADAASPIGRVISIPSIVTGLFTGSAAGFDATTVRTQDVSPPVAGLAWSGNGSLASA